MKPYRTFAIALALLTPATAQIRQENLRVDLAFLSSEALEGRRSLGPGSDAAVQFIVAEFTRAGLKPANGSSYLQPVPLVEYRVDTQETRLAIERGADHKSYSYLTDFIGGLPNEVTVRAPVVFAGYGITAPEFGYDDYGGIDARGKIVLVFDHEPQETDPKSIFNGTGNTRHANSLVKILNAQKHGAVGVLVLSEPLRKHPSPLERLARIPGGAQRLRRLPPQALAESEARIPLFSVSDAVGAALLASSGKTPTALQSAIDAKLQPMSQPLGEISVEMRVALEERRRGVSANVVGLLEGSDPTLRAETIVFSAHHDHDGIWDSKLYPGADDNGSGTVGVMELARAFAAAPTRPKRSLLFAIFAAEERGLLGSYYYVAHPLRPLETTRVVINFDMIGRNETPSQQTDGLVQIAADTSNELNLIGTVNSPAYRAVVERQNRDVALKLNYKWDDDAALNIFQRSDQFPFALRDIPAVWWFTGFHPDYHQTTDTIEKINFAKMERILRLAYLAGRSFADAGDVPVFVARPMQGSSQ